MFVVETQLLNKTILNYIKLYGTKFFRGKHKSRKKFVAEDISRGNTGRGKHKSRKTQVAEKMNCRDKRF